MGLTRSGPKYGHIKAELISSSNFLWGGFVNIIGAYYLLPISRFYRLRVASNRPDPGCSTEGTLESAQYAPIERQVSVA
jgi:hypothetical protein